MTAPLLGLCTTPIPLLCDPKTERSLAFTKGQVLLPCDFHRVRLSSCPHYCSKRPSQPPLRGGAWSPRRARRPSARVEHPPPSLPGKEKLRTAKFMLLSLAAVVTMQHANEIENEERIFP